MNQQTILAILAVSLIVGVLAVGELFMGWEQRRRIARQSAAFGDHKAMTGSMARLDSRLRKTDFGTKIGRRIAASGVRISVASFLLLMGSVIIAVVLLIGLWIAPVFGIFAAGAVAFTFFSFLRRREERRKEEFIAQLPELARVLSNATQAGLVLSTAVGIAAEELTEPAASELKRVADELRLGKPVEDALRDLGDRLPSRELAVLVSTLVVSARAGGSLVTALRTIAETLDERKETRREVQTILGEAIVTNWAIGALGMGALIMVNVISPGALRGMSENLIGQVVLAGSAIAFVLSLLLIRRITQIDI